MQFVFMNINRLHILKTKWEIDVSWYMKFWIVLKKIELKKKNYKKYLDAILCSYLSPLKTNSATVSKSHQFETILVKQNQYSYERIKNQEISH